MTESGEQSFLQKHGRTIFYVILGLSLVLAIFIKLYNLMAWEPFAAVCFCGAMGLLLDFAWRSRKSLWVIPPVLLCADLVGYVMKNMGHRDVAGLLFNFSGALWPITGLLLLRKGGQIWKSHRSAAWKLVVLGFLCVAGALWEYRMYLPQEFSSWIRYSVIYLGIFAMLLFIDFTENLAEKGLKFEQGILRVGLIVIAFKYFIDFVFV